MLLESLTVHFVISTERKLCLRGKTFSLWRKGSSDWKEKPQFGGTDAIKQLVKKTH
jgi:hypothetical protein